MEADIRERSKVDTAALKRGSKAVFGIVVGKLDTQPVLVPEEHVGAELIPGSAPLVPFRMPVRLSFDFERKIRPAAPHRLTTVHDGDTPTIDQPVRMVSADTPEKSGYAGGPAIAQPKLDLARARLEDGTYDAVPDDLRSYLTYLAPWFDSGELPPRGSPERRPD